MKSNPINYYKINELPSISAFPEDEFYWRIDWFGDISFPDRSNRRKQPAVFVHLSRVIAESFRDDPSVLHSPNSTAPPRNQTRAWVSVGTLAMMRIGDIWRNQKLFARPDYELETFTDIQIDKTMTNLIKAGLNLNEQGFLLPIAEHPWHLNCTQSYCIMVKLPDERRLIVPCMELIRFYFGSSGSLLNKLFMTGVSKKSLYSFSNFDYRTGLLNLELETGISGASASDIGRICADPVAWRAAAQISVSCIAASTTQKDIYPQTFFPFEGTTTLIAAGKWLSFGNKPKDTFIVYNLRSCSHPFPFDTLRYTARSSRPQTSPYAPKLNSGPASGQIFKPKGARDAKNQTLVEQDASRNLAPKTHHIRFESKFPDLTGKTIWKTEIVEPNAQAALGKHAKLPDVDQAAVGDPGSSRRVRPIALAVLLGTEDQKAIPAFLREIIEDISGLKSIRVEILTVSEHDGWTVPVTMLSDDDGEIDVRLFLNFEDLSARLRRACVIAFSKHSEQLCAVIIESPTPHIKLYPTTGQTSDEVWCTLRCATTDFLVRPEVGLEPIALRINDAFGIGETY